MIRSWWGDRVQEGSCNACQTHGHPRVLVVALRTVTVRLCRDCAEHLALDLVEAMDKEGKR